MTEPRIGRVLVASLHQGIADVLPDRLDFYENWLTAAGLRDGTIGLAALSAVLSFLRREGEAYNLITRRAGEHAADWTVSSMPLLERRIIRALPARLRRRMAMRTASALVRTTYPGSRAVVRIDRVHASVDLRGSLFCEVRQASVLPLCGFYAAAIAGVLRQFALDAEARIDECRAAGVCKECRLIVVMGAQGAGEPAAAA